MDSRARALLAGAGAGLRSQAPVAVLALRGRGPFPGPARFIALGAALGEIVADKQPEMGSRWARRGLTLRVAAAATVGADCAGGAGVPIAVLTALASARLGARIRAGADGGLAPAFAEDAVSYALLALATA